MGTGNLIVAQGGGPTLSINNCLCGIIEQATQEPAVDDIYGAKYGLEGILHKNLIDLEAERQNTIESLRATPGAALGSSRAKLSDENFEQILETFRTHDVRYVLYIGGNGSMAGCHRIHSMVTEKNMDVRVLGIPSTVDNDILHTDHCPGYGSASRYYAVSVRELGMDVESLPTPVSVFETMGRNTGWLAASTGLARDTDAMAPHLIYVPERPFTPDQFLDDVQRVYDELGWVVVAVSEGGGRTLKFHCLPPRWRAAPTTLGEVCPETSGFTWPTWSATNWTCEHALKSRASADESPLRTPQT
jgi:6-phosphofructokinase 1